MYQSRPKTLAQIELADLDFGTHWELTQSPGEKSSLNWTPDGQKIVYQWGQSRTSEIHLMNWDGTDDKKLTHNSPSGDLYPVLSPDGTRIAYFNGNTGGWALFQMDLNGANQQLIKGFTVYESIASWSPDGKSIAFTPWHNTEAPPFIASVNADGTNYQELTTRNLADSDPLWSPAGDLIAFTCIVDHAPQICTMHPDSSNRKALTKKPSGNADPVWSPDGKKIAFVSWRDSADPANCDGGDCNFEIYVMDADGSHQTRLTNDPAEEWNASWSPDGQQIAFVSLRAETQLPKDCGDSCNSEIYVMNADGSNVKRVTNNTVPDWGPLWRPPVSQIPAVSGTPTNTPIPALAQVQGGGHNQIAWWAQSDSAVNIYSLDLLNPGNPPRVIGEGESVAWSPDGSQIAYVGGTDSSNSEIYLMSADGRNRRKLTNTGGGAYEPAWSPDGLQIAYSRDHGKISLINVDGTNDHIILEGPGSNYAPAWSGDGQQIAYLSNNGGLQAALYITDKDGLHPRLLDSDTDWAAPPSWSHNNQWIAYGCNSQLVQICLIRPDGTDRQVLTSQDQNSGPQWSPNDQWLAFISYRDSNWEVYVMQPDGSQQTRVTTNWLQDFGPTWRP